MVNPHCAHCAPIPREKNYFLLAWKEGHQDYGREPFLLSFIGMTDESLDSSNLGPGFESTIIFQGPKNS